MSVKEETLDEKIARIRKQNEAIERRNKMIAEEIKDAERNGAIVKLKNQAVEAEEDQKFGATLYSDQLSTEKKIVKSFDEDIWNVKPRPRKSVTQSNKVDEAWREERKLIDEERIQRQKANSGSWKREWDADKTVSSNDRDNRAHRGAENKFDRSSSTNGRPENRAYNFNESKGNFNHYNTNNEDNFQSRCKTDNSFRKTYPERRSANDNGSDNRKSTIIRTDVRKISTSKTDKCNNNALKLYSRNNLRSSIQNTPSSTRNDEFDLNTMKSDPFDEENWDAQFTHDNIATKLYSKSNSRSGTHRPNEENVDENPAGIMKLVKQKEFLPDEDFKAILNSQERDRSSVARSKMRPAGDLNNCLAQPSKSPNANPPIPKYFENNYRNTESDSETNVIIPKDLKNIVVQVRNLGTMDNKREIKVFDESKNNFHVPKFTVNLNTSLNVDAKTSSGYGSMTFERSDLKRKVAPKCSGNLSSSTPIATQMFSNSKIDDSSYISSDANSKSNWFTETVNNCKQESFTDLMSPSVFQFSATPSKLDFEDIVHNTITPQDVKVIRTINNENIRLVKEPPRTNNYYKSKDTKSVEIKTDQSKKVEVKHSEAVKKNEVENTDVFGDNKDSDEEWDDCSDDETEEEFGFA